MTYLKPLTFSLFILFCFISCDTKLKEVNENPAALHEINLEYLLPGAIAGTYYSKGQLGAISAGFGSQQVDAWICGSIINSRDQMNTYWTSVFYSGFLKDIKVVVERAEKAGNHFYAGVGKILIAHAFGTETNSFGDMPFSEALKGGEDVLRPVYDSQEAIYLGILELLDEAIEDLNIESEYAGGDLVFDGDASRWIKNANALKMRYFLHLSKKDPAYLQDILEIKDQAVQNRDDQAIFHFGTSENETWSLHRWITERPSTLFVHPLLVSLVDEEDPRLAILFGDKEYDEYFLKQKDDNSVYWLRSNASVPLISLSEVHFIEAETKLRLGTDKAEISESIREAIIENMEMLEIDPADYQEYVDEHAILASNTDFEADLKHITIEAYKSYFGHNFNEAWILQRRTGYPELLPTNMPPNIWNSSGGPMQRFLYPQREFDTNREQVERAEANQNGALLDSPLWIF